MIECNWCEVDRKKSAKIEIVGLSSRANVLKSRKKEYNRSKEDKLS